MLRVTTLYAASAVATAAYYTRYLAEAPGEAPGRWGGRQAGELGLSGRVDTDDLQRLLEGRDPTGASLGMALRDRQTADGRVVRAVAGFDATFSAPKSVSVWWALTGDARVLAAHDLAVAVALEQPEQYGATTRIRHDGRRLHPDSLGLTMATFRQTTSRADDPQLHTHAVVSAKVQTVDGRWLALDARFLKRHQRMLGGLYQSVLRAELSHRFGIGWEPISNGQAEMTGIAPELLAQFSKRAAQVDVALAAKVAEFHEREGRDPSRWERAAMEREAAADTRGRKTGRTAVDLNTRWLEEAQALGWTPERLTKGLTDPGRERPSPPSVTVERVLDQLSTAGSTWTRADVLRAVCDVAPPPVEQSGREWAAELERITGVVLAQCVDLDSASDARRRGSDGRSVWVEPTSPHYTSPTVLAEEERILTWTNAAQLVEPQPSATVDTYGLDVLQADAAAAVAGRDRLVLVVGPAGTGKTTMLRAAVNDLRRQGRTMFGIAPTAKAAHVLAAETGMTTDTLAKLLHEWTRAGRLPDDRYRLPMATTIVVDEASMVGTASLHRLIDIADSVGWRLVLVGDPRQLQAVGRGGLFAELCSSGRSHELVRIHRFSQQWEAYASLQLRSGRSEALDRYQEHGRIRPGTVEEHLARIAADWLTLTEAGQTVAVVASRNEQVDALNAAIQQSRIEAGQLDPSGSTAIAGGERACVGEAVMTRRNDRRLVASSGDTVRNRDSWTVTATCPDGSVTLARPCGAGTVSLPADYVTQHVRLGYAATEHGHQGETVDVGISLTSAATTHRGLYVATTRGREENRIHVITDTNDLTEAREILDGVLTREMADVPATAQRRHLAEQADQPARPEVESRVPDWVEPWQHQLHARRQLLVDGLDDRERLRALAVRDLEELQPELDAARQAWEPFARTISDLERRLQTELREGASQARDTALHAPLGRRRSAQRCEAHAAEALQQAHAAIRAIHADHSEIEQHLDCLQHRADKLAGHVDPGDRRDDTDRGEVRRLDLILDAADTYVTWLEGQPTPTARLVHAVATLDEVAQRAPNFARRPGEIERTQWYQLLDVAPDHLSRAPVRSVSPVIR